MCNMYITKLATTDLCVERGHCTLQYWVMAESEALSGAEGAPTEHFFASADIEVKSLRQKFAFPVFLLRSDFLLFLEEL